MVSLKKSFRSFWFVSSSLGFMITFLCFC